MSWKTYSERKKFIDGVLDEVAANGTGVFPGAWGSDIDNIFGGVDEFLLALHQRWANNLNGSLDPYLAEVVREEALGGGRRDSVTGGSFEAAVRRFAGAQPATVRLLAKYAGHPVLQEAMQRHYDQLPVAARTAIRRVIALYEPKPDRATA